MPRYHGVYPYPRQTLRSILCVAQQAHRPNVHLRPQHAHIQAALQRLLEEPLLTGQIASGNLTMMRQLRFLVLKNLAGLLAVESQDRRMEALGLYSEAAALDGGDLMLWNKLGLLVWWVGCCIGECAWWGITKWRCDFV